MIKYFSYKFTALTMLHIHMIWLFQTLCLHYSQDRSCAYYLLRSAKSSRSWMGVFRSLFFKRTKLFIQNLPEAFKIFSLLFFMASMRF